MADQQQNDDLGLDTRMDAASLYKEDIITDRKVGTIRMLTPLLTTGERDSARPLLFAGETQIMTQMGALPISFEIEAATLAEAVEKYGEAAQAGIRRTIEKIQEMRREAAHQIVTPDMPGFQAPPSGTGGLVMP